MIYVQDSKQVLCLVHAVWQQPAGGYQVCYEKPSVGENHPQIELLYLREATQNCVSATVMQAVETH